MCSEGPSQRWLNCRGMTVYQSLRVGVKQQSSFEDRSLAQHRCIQAHLTDLLTVLELLLWKQQRADEAPSLFPLKNLKSGESEEFFLSLSPAPTYHQGLGAHSGGSFGVVRTESMLVGSTSICSKGLVALPLHDEASSSSSRNSIA